MAQEYVTQDVEIVVPVGSGEEELLLGETLSQFAQTLAGEPPDTGTFLMVKSEYGRSGLIKKIIFEDAKPAGEFRSLWRAAKSRLSEQ